MTTGSPKIENAAGIIVQSCNNRVRELYGEDIPDKIRTRLDDELSGICRNGFAVKYLIAKHIVDRAAQERQPASLRGCVGSSFAAYLLGITGINPLCPHYYCPACRQIQLAPEASSGFDLPNKPCPICGGERHGDGHNLPSESFAGLNGDKEPAFEINVTRTTYEQSKEILQELFPNYLIVRCGSRRPHSDVLTENTMGWLIVPPDRISEVALAHIESDGRDVLVTEQEHYELWNRFEYQHILHNSALDCLKELSTKTGVPLEDIPVNAPDIYKAFRPGNIENILGVPSPEDYNWNLTAEIFSVVTPNRFSDLVKVLGLLHGTDVWDKNTEVLIQNKKSGLANIISDRENIFERLIASGASRPQAYEIMEAVRKGKGCTLPENIFAAYDLPAWYENTCMKIRYLFPRAHLVYTAKIAVRAMWFKLHYPIEYEKVFTELCAQQDM